ncbi:MAG: HAD-IIB family hydrolase [Acidipropionibacterium acidipropionici]|uniref:HAD-IIB family hydrolase n=1 Tax=Acidipropionibacterium acidipropionici TaxID=1748 RepID=UPI002F35961D
MTAKLPQVVVFDLDDTLAPSKTRLPDQMAGLLGRLLSRTQVCVISGGQFGQFRTQVVEPLDGIGAAHLDRLHLMPACGTQYYRFINGQWSRVYLEALSADEKTRAKGALEACARRLGLWESHTWGAPIEDRDSQITFSALGQEAPVNAKRSWDPTGEKKLALREAVAAELPDLEVRAGGSTSVDITRVGRDKSFGMEKLMESTGLSKEDLLFYGDRLDVHGNDYPVKAMGVPCLAVRDWQDTVAKLEELLGAEPVA